MPSRGRQRVQSHWGADATAMAVAAQSEAAATRAASGRHGTAAGQQTQTQHGSRSRTAGQRRMQAGVLTLECMRECAVVCVLVFQFFYYIYIYILPAHIDNYVIISLSLIFLHRCIYCMIKRIYLSIEIHSERNKLAHYF
jgi:hypothetical protein